MPVLVAAGVAAAQPVIAPGTDCYETTAGSTRIVIGGASKIPPIPADFFFAGSQPWEGVIELRGEPLPGYPGAVNTRIERKQAADVSAGATTIDVELVELSLVSMQPIIVHAAGGDSFFDVFVTLNPAIPSTGLMSIEETAPGLGGQANLDTGSGGGIHLYARFNFFEAWPAAAAEASLGTPLILDSPPLLLETTAPQNWQYAVPPIACDPGNGYYPVPGEETSLVLDGGLSGEHGIIPPRTTDGCCLPDGTCVDVDPGDCTLLGGTPQGAPCTGTTIACCLPDGSCVDVDPLCCDDMGGYESPHAVACIGDLNGNGIDDACEPQACVPTPTGDACEPVVCPIAGQSCTPTRIYVDPVTGQVTVLRCECISFDQCHVDLFGPGGEPVWCPGGCAVAGDVCNLISSDTDGDGIDDTFECRCESQLVGCCAADGTCTNELPGQCSGVEQATPCTGTTEACCLPDGTCTDVDPVCCDDLGGVPQGPGTDCTTTVCHPTKWTQPPKPDQPRVWYYSAEPALGPPPPAQPAADDFECQNPNSIVDAHWWGTQALGGGVFRIRFYSDVPAGADPDPSVTWSHPGTELYQVDVADWTQQWDAAANAWYFSADLPTPFDQTLGTIYWFSTAYVHATQGWSWLQSINQWNDFAVQWIGGPWIVPADQVDLAFELTTTGGPPVCAPTPTGDACEAVVCPIAGQSCTPTEIQVDPFTGVLVAVLACDCIGPNDCHVEPAPGNDPPVTCAGTCPPGEVCNLSGRDTDGDGIDDTFQCLCEPPLFGCCWADGTCTNEPAGMCGGVEQTTPCTGTTEACCLPDGTCADVDPICCDDLGGTAQGPGTGCVDMVVACCLPDGSCVDVDPICCDDMGGTPSTYAGSCMGDTNGNGIDDACEPPVCQPSPDGQSCEVTPCLPLVPERECSPICANYDPGTGVSVLTECECLDIFAPPCRINVTTDPPTCTGGACPAGTECVRTETALTDGTIDICCRCVAPTADLGDAPDSSNSFFAPMTAYPSGGPPGTPANFPTVYVAGSPPHGPIHWQPEAVAYLGDDVTFENEADIGPDEDGVNNLDPPGDKPDQDAKDDGVQVPLTLPNCTPTTFDYVVTLVGAAAQPLYVNVWFDWTRDGDWDDTPQCPDGTAAPEWAVQNQVLPPVGPGRFTLTTPAFVPWHPLVSPTDAPEIWMRITLSGQPWNPVGPGEGYGGSGPPDGYNIGETEDYYFKPLLQPPVAKWSQPPVPADNVFYGWNEYSQCCNTMVADDWYCDTADPVTTIRWWGSYKGWKGTAPPPSVPFDHFHIWIWTDVPVGNPGNVEPFSHPGVLLQDILAFNYTEEFVGWDYDPRTGEYEAAFKYEYVLDPSEYFFQQPGGNVYWLGVGAGCTLDPGPYPWGWKTVPHDATSLAPDDAVIMPNTAHFCPLPGATWQDIGGGSPIFWPTPDDSWDMAFELITKPQVSIFKWGQFPDLETTGGDVHATFTTTNPPHVLADDFECTVTGPLTHIELYGSWYQDMLPMGDPGNVMFRLSLHDDIPAEQSPTGYSMPGNLLWSREFLPGDFVVNVLASGLQEWWITPSPGGDVIWPGDTTCWAYGFNLGPTEFWQDGTAAAPKVYWLDVQAFPMDPVARFGWKTSLDHWSDDAVYAIGEDVPGTLVDWQEVRYPGLHPMAGQSVDLAFQIWGEPAERTKWSQPPMPYVPTTAFKGWDELSVYGGPQIVADDWACNTTDPVTDVHWWGSYLGWDQTTPPNLPDAFHIGIWTDVPAGVDQAFSHPGALIHEYVCDNYRWEFVGWDFDPRDLSRAPEATFKYTCDLPQASWFYQDPGDNIYWVSIAAQYAIQPADFAWGWKTRPRDVNSKAPDDAVAIWNPTAPSIGSAYGAGGPLWWPTEADSWDMAFELTTTSEAPEACCLIDGTCVDMTPVSCRHQGGAPQGSGTTCADTVCPAPPLIHFSTELSFVASGGPHNGQTISEGDELRDNGTVVNTNLQLLAQFCEMPPAAEHGLDALHHQSDGSVLFSTETGWFDECLGQQISDGDLLRNDGTVVKTNADLMANFHPQPVVPDVGLDAVHVVESSGEILFSIEADIFDEVLGVFLKHGDLLSDTGAVVRTNEQLMSHFCPMPIVVDMGLDAVSLRDNGEIWFSTETGWFDECLGIPISDGDLLSDAGYVVKTNADLVGDFFAAGLDVPDEGLDAVWVAPTISGCGQLVMGPQGCTQFLSDNGQRYFLENLDGFTVGQRVWVSGVFNPASLLCPPIVGLGIEDNTICTCFEGCGVLVQGTECVMFQADSGGLYVLDNRDGFNVGAHVWVRGCLNPGCVTTCLEGDGCIHDNSIGACLACCYPDGSCASVSAVECAATGGTPQGAGTACLGDADGNGVDDACQVCWEADPAEPQMIRDAAGGLVVSTSNRYLSFSAGEAGRNQAIRVTFSSMPPGWEAWNGVQMYVQEPFLVSNLPSRGFGDPVGPEGGFWAATLDCTPHFRDWSSFDAVHVYHEGVVPSHLATSIGPIDAPAVYDVEVIDATCPLDDANYSPALTLTDCGWCDIGGPFGPGGKVTAPDQRVDVPIDIVALQDGFSGLGTAPPKWRTDLEGAGTGFVEGKINITEVVLALDAFAGVPYPFGPTGPPPCSGPMSLKARSAGEEPVAALRAPRRPSQKRAASATTPLRSRRRDRLAPVTERPASITLVPAGSTVPPGSTMAIDVFVNNVPDLRAYQVTLSVGQGEQGAAALENFRINSDRADYVFGATRTIRAVDPYGGRIASALFRGGVEVGRNAYLGSCTLRAPADGAGEIRVTVQTRDQASLLLDSATQRVPFVADPIVIRVQPPSRFEQTDR